MTVPAHILRASLDDALEVVALTDVRGREVARPCFEWMRGLSDFDVPEEYISAGFEFLRQCCSYNADLAAAGRRLSYRLDQLAEMRPLSVKALAAALRPHLAMIATPAAEQDAYVQAVCAVRDIVEATPFDRLAGGGMRRALGPGRHALLMSFVEGHAEPLLTQHTTRHDRAPTAGCAGGEATGSLIPLDADGLAPTFEEAA